MEDAYDNKKPPRRLTSTIALAFMFVLGFLCLLVGVCVADLCFVIFIGDVRVALAVLIVGAPLIPAGILFCSLAWLRSWNLPCLLMGLLCLLISLSSLAMLAYIAWQFDTDYSDFADYESSSDLPQR